MNETIEMKLSNYVIDKATARLAYQRDAVHRLGADATPRSAQIAQQTLAAMEQRLARLLVAHAGLLNEQGRTHHDRLRRLRSRFGSRTVRSEGSASR